MVCFASWGPRGSTECPERVPGGVTRSFRVLSPEEGGHVSETLFNSSECRSGQREAVPPHRLGDPTASGDHGVGLITATRRCRVRTLSGSDCVGFWPGAWRAFTDRPETRHSASTLTPAATQHLLARHRQRLGEVRPHTELFKPAVCQTAGELPPPSRASGVRAIGPVRTVPDTDCACRPDPP